MTPGQEAAATAYLNSSNKLPTLRPTHSARHTWMHLDHRFTPPPPETTLTDATHRPPSTKNAPLALMTNLFVNKEPAPVLGSVVPDTTRSIQRMSVTEDLDKRLPSAPPPYSSVPASLQLGHPAVLSPGASSGFQPGHPAALHPGAPPAKQGSNDELDRVVSMYYDRRPSEDSVANSKNWL
jgi:hypothetical protein